MTLLKTHIEFRSDNFPPTSEEKEEWDRQIWGHTLAKYLSEELPKYGLNVSDFINEDWGYLIPLADEKFKGIWVGCNHYQEYENGFLVFIDPCRPIIKKGFFKKIDISEQLTFVADILNEILTTNPEIYAQHWWDENDMKLIGK